MRGDAGILLLLSSCVAAHVILSLSPVSDLSKEHGAPNVPFPHRPHHRVTGFVAFGDSYSAGIGTGVNGTESACRRGLGAYPLLIHSDVQTAAGTDETSFQHLSCTGAGVDDVLAGAPTSQIDGFNTTGAADFALLSIGGNDLGFFDIMNSCIFRFYSFGSGTCEAALLRAEAALRGPTFERKLHLAIMEILDKVQWEKKLWFTITVTGYARFFNDETEECDDYSFGVWWRGPKLKRELRRRMNEMVLAVNQKIRESIEAINARFASPRVIFVDYDDAFEGHRFCEPNVVEPDYARNDTWFFLVGGRDNAQDSPETPSPGEVLAADSPLIDPARCLESAEQAGDWDELALCPIAMAARDDPSLRTRAGETLAETSMWHVPTSYGQTFHPRSAGHLAIRDEIYRRWNDERVAILSSEEL